MTNSSFTHLLQNLCQPRVQIYSHTHRFRLSGCPRATKTHEAPAAIPTVHSYVIDSSEAVCFFAWGSVSSSRRVCCTVDRETGERVTVHRWTCKRVPVIVRLSTGRCHNLPCRITNGQWGYDELQRSRSVGSHLHHEARFGGPHHSDVITPCLLH